MSRALWMATGAAVGLGAIGLATRSARASTLRAMVSAGPAPRPVAPAGAPGGAPPGAVESILPTAPGRLSPLLRAHVSPNGGFRVIRTRGHGSCPRGSYPCTHWGVDLVPEGHDRGPVVEADRVRAPEDLVVDFVARDDETPPLSGYGPGAVLARGRSGTWHVFGHLSPRSLGLVKGAAIARGVFFARLASSGLKPPHLHWELRRWRTEGPAARALGRAATRADIVIDPDLWLREAA